jgi:hypothetical protein
MRWRPPRRWASASAAGSWAAPPGDHPGAPQREFDLDLIATAPSVVYHINKIDGSQIDLHNPADMPDPTYIDSIEEPWIKATILTPTTTWARSSSSARTAAASSASSATSAPAPCSSTTCR